jgi:hypothetical protein
MDDAECAVAEIQRHGETVVGVELVLRDKSPRPLVRSWKFSPQTTARIVMTASYLLGIAPIPATRNVSVTIENSFKAGW